jgi:hypothetical protein
MSTRQYEHWFGSLLSDGSWAGRSRRSTHLGHTTHGSQYVLLLGGWDWVCVGGYERPSALLEKPDGDPRNDSANLAELYMSRLPGCLRRGALVARNRLSASRRCAQAIDALFPCIHDRQCGLVHEAASTPGTSHVRRYRLGGDHRRAVRLDNPGGGLRWYRACHRWCALECGPEPLSQDLDQTFNTGE